MPASAAEQMAVIKRGTESIIPEDELLKKLDASVRAGRPLRVKYGIDPTGVDVHLGHTVPMRKLRQFQRFGHRPVIIIGNYTAMVGDPSGRDETRARLTPEQVEQNAQDYLRQLAKIIDLDQAELHRNGDWFSRMTFLEMLSLLSQATVSQLLTRDDFAKRLKEESPIYLHECVYSLMQGQDSVEVRADVELGGSEQLFSLMLARDLQRAAGQEPQVAITFPILVGTDGVRRMGKSLGNYIGIGEPPGEMFGKVMSLADASMRQFFELVTDVPLEEVDRLLGPDTHPRDAKARLGAAIVTEYHGADAARQAAEQFDQVFRDKQDPDDVAEVAVAPSALSDGRMWGPRLLVTAGLAPSHRQAKALIAQGGVTSGEERTRWTDTDADVGVHDGMIVRVGSRKIVRIRLR